MSPARGDSSQGTFFETYGNPSFGRYFLCYKKYIAALALVIAAVVAASLLPPQVLRLIVDDYLMAGKAEGLLAMGGIYLGTFALVGFFDLSLIHI